MTQPEPPRAPIVLNRPRDLGALVRDGLRLYFREWRTFILVALVVVIPVELIVGGVGLGQFTAGYDDRPSPEATLIPMLAEALVITPLLTSMCIFTVLDAADGKKPRAREVIQRGLDIFGPLLVVMAMLLLAVFAGLFVLIVGALVAAVYLAFSMQAAVIDGSRGADALRRSFELVHRSFWRVLGVVLVAFAVTYLPSALIGTPLLELAKSTDRAVFQLLAGTVGVAISAPPLAVIMTLLYFDQRARKAI